MNSEPTDLLDNLTYSAKAGGYFFMGLALFGLGLMLLVPLGVFELSATASPNFVGLWLMFCVGLMGIGGWLLDYKRRLRRALANRQTFYPARLLERHGPTEFGWFIKVEVERSPTQLQRGKQRFLEEPHWLVGDRLVICVLADGRRFFPKELTQRADVGYLQT
ncbi:hypothetical protein [Leptolyngbya iicbica]|uniref:Uncharacterized protein n=2 Tax=Cyanophyceae TaxID=3028117 RepID=A0A4Q7EAY4_9CYAN|nr:hypothetical protein [Leptolyngbya sp. LK]RZM79654.1 hypothetical protein DYY88_13190 [Leptolyngbya sp. LK]